VLLPGLFNHAVLTPRHLLLSLLFIPHHDPYGSLFPVLIPGWTLTYEMYFYGLFGLGLASPRRWRGMAICGALLALVGAGALFGPFDFAAATTYTSPLLLEFAAGIVLARWRLSTRPCSRALWPWPACGAAGGGSLVAGDRAARQAPGLAAAPWRRVLRHLPDPRFRPGGAVQAGLARQRLDLRYPGGAGGLGVGGNSMVEARRGAAHPARAPRHLGVTP